MSLTVNSTSRVSFPVNPSLPSLDELTTHVFSLTQGKFPRGVDESQICAKFFAMNIDAHRLEAVLIRVLDKYFANETSARLLFLLNLEQVFARSSNGQGEPFRAAITAQIASNLGRSRPMSMEEKKQLLIVCHQYLACLGEKTKQTGVFLGEEYCSLRPISNKDESLFIEKISRKNRDLFLEQVFPSLRRDDPCISNLRRHFPNAEGCTVFSFFERLIPPPDVKPLYIEAAPLTGWAEFFGSEKEKSAELNGESLIRLLHRSVKKEHWENGGRAICETTKQLVQENKIAMACALFSKALQQLSFEVLTKPPVLAELFARLVTLEPKQALELYRIVVNEGTKIPKVEVETLESAFLPFFNGDSSVIIDLLLLSSRDAYQKSLEKLKTAALRSLVEPSRAEQVPLILLERMKTTPHTSEIVALKWVDSLLRTPASSSLAIKQLVPSFEKTDDLLIKHMQGTGPSFYLILEDTLLTLPLDRFIKFYKTLTETATGEISLEMQHGLVNGLKKILPNRAAKTLVEQMPSSLKLKVPEIEILMQVAFPVKPLPVEKREEKKEAPSPPSLTALLAKAQTLRNQKTAESTRNAIALLEESRTRYPKSDKLLSELGALYLSEFAEDGNRAINVLLRVKNKTEKTHFHISQGYLLLGDSERAIKSVEETHDKELIFEALELSLSFSIAAGNWDNVVRDLKKMRALSLPNPDLDKQIEFYIKKQKEKMKLQ